MDRRQFIKGVFGTAGALALGRRLPSSRMKDENSELAKKVEFDIVDNRISYPEKLDFNLGNEEKLSEDLIWEQPRKYNGEGDCDDFAVFILDALDAQCYEAACVTGILEAEVNEEKRTSLHMWSESRIKGDYYVFDVNYRDKFLNRNNLSQEKSKLVDNSEKISSIKYRPVKMFDREGKISHYQPEF